MPIKNRTDMLSTGIRTTLGVKVFGPDLVTIQTVGAEIEALLAPVEGTGSIFAERSFGGRYLDIRPDSKALARYGLGVGEPTGRGRDGYGRPKRDDDGGGAGTVSCAGEVRP